MGKWEQQIHFEDVCYSVNNDYSMSVVSPSYMEHVDSNSVLIPDLKDTASAHKYVGVNNNLWYGWSNFTIA